MTENPTTLHSDPSPSRNPDAQAGRSNALTKRDILEHVVLETEANKRYVREILDSAFGFIAETLAAGQDVNCPPLGRIKIIKRKTNKGLQKLYNVNLSVGGQTHDVKKM
ncbi:hypothetical protein GCM10007939_07390 [Amylibacter marinus]|uniref:HU domain-containing protein n=1 Tax=Amylibacter marinus TaxID=1475483 RepID=A0ABQ5VSW5_9RHOB|nr:HU family DNA-binding protein [Amylibacter marinus]GLQ34456.1 hypothetical protein GCM10007939_07390 [Amylibacter marinus]